MGDDKRFCRLRRSRIAYVLSMETKRVIKTLVNSISDLCFSIVLRWWWNWAFLLHGTQFLFTGWATRTTRIENENTFFSSINLMKVNKIFQSIHYLSSKTCCLFSNGRFLNFFITMNAQFLHEQWTKKHIKRQKKVTQS